MINLVLDTNAWIYLANGYNPNTQKYNTESHFEMIDWMEEKMSKEQLYLFTNYIIEEEWKRNKQSCLNQIGKLNETLNQSQRFVKNSNHKPNFAEIKEKEEQKQEELKLRIERNEAHIEKVEKIIQRSQKIPVTDEQKLTVVGWALDKRAPFHNKPNSVADALIFLSVVEFFDYYPDVFIEDTIFVSNNSKDFSDGKNKMALHPDLQKLIELKPIKYVTNLPAIMGLGANIIEEYARYSR